MDKYHMTDHKLLWHLDRLNDWSKGERIVPLRVELGLTNTCQLKCIFCYAVFIGKQSSGDRIDLPKEIIKKFFNDAKKIGVRSVVLVGEGENSVSPFFYDTLEYARNVNLDLGIATNGVAFTRGKIREILESFTWIRFNLSAADKDSYKLIHGKDWFNIVVDNIKECVRIKKEYGLKTTLGLQMVVIKENIQEIISLSKLGADLGVDYFVAKPCCDTPDGQLGIFRDDYLHLSNVFDEAESFGNDNYSVIIKRDKFKSVEKTGFNKCHGTQFVIAIDSRGNVAPCAHLHGHRREEFSMGNISEQSFSEIISSNRYWEIQKKVQELDPRQDCELNCMHTAMNIFLERLKNPPKHLNFV